MNAYAMKNTEENLAWSINKLLDLIEGHDAVHPDRDECGGVGGCLMMSAEVDSEQQLENSFSHLAKHGLRITVKLAKK